MEKTTLRFFLFYVLFISSFSVHQSLAKTQSETLGQFYKAKRKVDSAIDKGHYTSHHPVVHDHHILSQKGLKEKDRIHGLPGQPHISHHNFKQYGGYVTVNVTYGRALYYYFVEANSHKKDLPLLLWLNGGPGCSSIGYGAFEELGPFRVNSDGKTLYSNKYAWNHAANVLFLESPAGVGFSYSNNTNDPNLQAPGDKKTAEDNLIFLLNWLERFPEYKKRDFYISGESYAGHYVPQLAHSILSHNKHSKKTIINLKGIIFGNAVINDETDNWGMYDYFASHALVSDKDVEEMHKVCDFSDGGEESEKCQILDETVELQMGNIDIYNIYAPLCLNSTYKPKRGSVLKYDPCSDDYIHAYLNRPEVQKALHANVTKIPYDWEPCSDALFQGWTDSPSTIIPLLKEFLANGIRVWIYSGDTDGRVPVTSTRYSINAMKLHVTSPWRPWYLDSEVGGYTEGYVKNLTFATVRSAGHEVPSYQPARALTLIKRFLAGKPLPSS